MSQSRSAYGVLGATIFAVLLLLFVYNVAEILLLLFIAALFSLYLAAVTDFLQRRLNLPRGVGLTVGLTLTLVGLVAIGWLIIPPVLEQTEELISTLPVLLAGWEADLLQLAARYPLIDDMLPSPDATQGYFRNSLTRIGGYFAGLFPYLFSGLHVIINVFSVLVMGIYLTLRPLLYREGLIALVPPVHRELARDILQDLAHTLRSWIVGQILAMIFLGTLTWIGLILLNVPYALAFGVFTGIVVIVPFFGTLVSTLLPALFVLGQEGLFPALLVVLLGVVIHLLEANLIHPMIMERKVNLPPVLSILSVLVMAELLGVIGLLVAVPVLATTMVIVRRIYVHRLLEGKGFRRSIRDSAIEIKVPDGLARAVAGGEVDVPAFVERSRR
ncbi:MAG TPA: AI-2E family transporter [Longimicrobiaceae bacterium]|nr:AI-2E family transporter [Longimicrobiaceae bacterium]